MFEILRSIIQAILASVFITFINFSVEFILRISVAVDPARLEFLNPKEQGTMSHWKYSENSSKPDCFCHLNHFGISTLVEYWQRKELQYWSSSPLRKLVISRS